MQELARRASKLRINIMVARAALCLLLAGCTVPPGAPPSAPEFTQTAAIAAPVEPSATTAPPATPAPTLQEVAEAAVQSDGMILSLAAGDPQRVVFLFEEDHRSIASQVQIARVMLRLYEDHGFRSVGLEGWYASEGNLPTGWADLMGKTKPGSTAGARAEVLTRALLDGDLSAAEWLGLNHSDVRVTGLDDSTLYAVTPLAEAENAPYTVLYAIALIGMSEDQLDMLQQLFDQGAAREAYTYAYQTDEWCAGVFERLQDNVNIASAEEVLALLDEIEAKAVATSAKVSPETLQQLDAARGYFGVVAQRSEVMAAGLLALAQAAGGVPVAASVGATHTSQMTRILVDAGVSLVVVRPRAQAEGVTAGMLDAEGYARREAGISALPAGSLTALLDGRRRPRPAAAATWFQQEALLRALLYGALEEAQHAHGAEVLSLTPDESAALLSASPSAAAVEWLSGNGITLMVTGFSGTAEPTLSFFLSLPDGLTLPGQVRLAPGAGPPAGNLDELLVAGFGSLTAGEPLEDGWQPVASRVQIRLESGNE